MNKFDTMHIEKYMKKLNFNSSSHEKNKWEGMLHFSVRKLSIKDFKSSHTDVSIVSSYILNLMSSYGITNREA